MNIKSALVEPLCYPLFFHMERMDGAATLEKVFVFTSIYCIDYYSWEE